MCAPWNIGCLLSSGAKTAASAVTNSFLDELRKSCVDATVSLLKTLGTFWLDIPSPNLNAPLNTATGNPVAGTGDPTSGVAMLQGYLVPFTLIAAVVGLILCGARMGMTARGEHGVEGAKMLVRLVAVSAAGAVVVALLTKAGDDFSPWLINKASGQPFDKSAPSLLGQESLLAMTPFLTIIVSIFAIFGSIALVIFMILRSALLLVLVAVWPLAASMTTSEQGMQWYKKINAWIIAFVLFKPVAAIIYASGFLLLKGGHNFTTTDPTSSALMGTLAGMAILGLAGLSLPALLRFVSPMTAAGTGSMSGGAAMGAAIAVGATVVSVGAGAAAGGAGAAGGASGGGAASGGAASSAGGGSSAAAGGTSGGEGGGPTGGGGSAGGDPSGVGGGGGAGGSSGGGESSGMAAEMVASADGGGAPGGGGDAVPAGSSSSGGSASSSGGAGGGAPTGGSAPASGGAPGAGSAGGGGGGIPSGANGTSNGDSQSGGGGSAPSGGSAPGAGANPGSGSSGSAPVAGGSRNGGGGSSRWAAGMSEVGQQARDVAASEPMSEPEGPSGANPVHQS